MVVSRGLMSVLCSVLLLGCASLEEHAGKRGDGSSAGLQLIATDLVSMLVQVPSISVGSTTLNLPAEQFAENDFGRVLQHQLEEVGYAIRTTGTNPRDSSVAFSIDSPSDTVEGDPVRTYTVSIDTVSVRRQYADFDSAAVQPVSSMQIKGAVADNLQVNDSLFAPVEESPAKVAESARQQDQAGAADSGQLASESLSNAGLLSRQSFGSDLQQIQQRERLNFREIQRSNFSDVYHTMSKVREALIPFGNDAVALDPIAEEEIARFLGAFNAETDVFSVIGCSNGRTQAPAGPQGLALGRAAAVTTELKRLSVPAQSILEEGCWSGEHYDEMMPRRGVVLTLYRLPASS